MHFQRLVLEDRRAESGAGVGRALYAGQAAHGGTPGCHQVDLQGAVGRSLSQTGVLSPSPPFPPFLPRPYAQALRRRICAAGHQTTTATSAWACGFTMECAVARSRVSSAWHLWSRPTAQPSRVRPACHTMTKMHVNKPRGVGGGGKGGATWSSARHTAPQEAFEPWPAGHKPPHAETGRQHLGDTSRPAHSASKTQ